MNKTPKRCNRGDIKQYVDGSDKVKVAKIYEMVPLQLAKDNHKFQFSKMEKVLALVLILIV